MSHAREEALVSPETIKKMAAVNDAECARIREKLMSDGPHVAARGESGVEPDARARLREKLLRDDPTHRRLGLRVSRGGVRSLNARLARLEQHIPEPQGPIVCRVLFHDGTPVWPGMDDGSSVPAEAEDMVYRIHWCEQLAS